MSIIRRGHKPSFQAISLELIHYFFEIEQVTFNPLEMNYSLFVSIDAKSYLNLQILLKSILFNLEAVAVDNRNLNKCKNTLFFPSSSIFLTLRISV